MVLRQKLLIQWACCCLLLLTDSTTRADFSGVAAVVRTDLTICQDTSQDDIEEPLTVCSFYAVFDDPTDELQAVGNFDITTTDPAGFFQHPFGADVSPDCNSIPTFPALVCDSFLTIGVSCDDGTDAAFPDSDFRRCQFNCDMSPPYCGNNQICGVVVGGWFNTNAPNGQGDAGTYPDNLVFFMQLSVRAGERVSGEADLFWRDNVNDENRWAPILLSCPQPCPADLSADGRVGSFDLALLLNSWGPNPGDPADLDGDGVVGALDLSILLGAWGTCL